MMRVRCTEKDFWREFLRMYKNLPCLWDRSHKNYKLKGVRDKAYQILLEKYKEIEEDAGLYDVKRKIDRFRNGFTRELKKVIESQACGSDIFVPSLWYYNELTFLENTVRTFTSVSTNPNLIKNDSHQTNDESSDEQTDSDNDDAKSIVQDTPILLQVEDFDTHKSESVPKTNQIHRKRFSKDNSRLLKRQYSPELRRTLEYLPEKRIKSENFIKNDSTDNKRKLGDDILALMNNSVEEDDSATFAANLKVQMRSLETTQKYIAQKLISLVMFLALTNQLTYDSSVSTKESDATQSGTVSHSFTPVHVMKEDPLVCSDSD